MYRVNLDEEVLEILSPLHQFIMDIVDFLSIQSSIQKNHTKQDIITFMQELKVYNIKLFNVSNNSKLKEHLYKMKVICLDHHMNLRNQYNNYIRNYQTILDCENTECYLFDKVIQDAFEYIYINTCKMENFKKNYINSTDNGNILHEYRKRYSEGKVCPYCDLNELEFDLTSIDHFLPKSKYPILSIFPQNLVVACTACNDRIKKEYIYFPVCHPFFDNISDYFTFKFSEDLKEINMLYLDSPSLFLEKTKNTHKLFKIQERYTKKVKRFKKELKELRDKVKERIKDISNTNNRIDEHTIRRIYIEECTKYTSKLENMKGEYRLTKIRFDLINYALNNTMELDIEYLITELNIVVRDYSEAEVG